MEKKGLTIAGKPAMKVLALPLAVALLLFFMLIPMGPDVSREAQNCIAVFFFFIVIFVAEPWPMALSCAMVLPVLLIFKVCNTSMFLKNGVQDSIFTILASFVIAAAMIKSNLGKRLTLTVLSKFGFSTKGITLGIVIVNILLCVTTSSFVCRYVILSPIVISLIDACKNPKAPESSKFAKNIMMTTIATNLTMTASTYTSLNLIAQMMGMLEGYGLPTYDYAQYIRIAFPVCLVLTVASWAFIQIIFKPDKDDISDVADKTIITGQLKEMGKITPNEVRTAYAVILAFLGYVFGGKIGFSIPGVTLAAATLLTLPGIGFLTYEDWKKEINWSMFFIVSGSVALGGILYETGAAAVIGNFIYTTLGFSKMGYAVGVLVFAIVVNYMHVLFVGTGPMTSAFIPITVGLCLSTGWHGSMIAIGIEILIVASSLMLFCSNTVTLMMMGTNKVEANDFIKYGFPFAIISAVIVWLAVLFYWPTLGIF